MASRLLGFWAFITAALATIPSACTNTNASDSGDPRCASLCPDPSQPFQNAMCSGDLEGCTCPLHDPCESGSGTLTTDYRCTNGGWKFVETASDCASVSGSSSTGMMLPECGPPDRTVSWKYLEDGSVQCGANVDQIDPTAYIAADAYAYVNAIADLRNRVPITIDFEFDTCSDAQAAYRVKSNGDGTATVTTWWWLDLTPTQAVSQGAVLASVDALAACESATTAIDQITCVKAAFTIDGSDPTCIVQTDGFHTGAPP
jgi:hypothetical protein